MLDAPRGEDWCEMVDCDEEWERGVTFRPREGSGVFWMNMERDVDGVMRGDERTLHAGLPVTSGGKVGMNIWTREAPLGREFRGGD
jgi:prolyl 4-hydroxylase